MAREWPVDGAGRVIGFFFGLALGMSQPAIAESRGTFYVLQMDPRGGESLDEPGWGLGGTIAIPLVSTRKTIKLIAGFDTGNLEARFSEVTEQGEFATTQDYQRIFGGAEIGRNPEARIHPHFGVDLVVLRQDETTHFFDPFSGETFAGSSNSSTRLAYDLSAGLGIAITSKTGLDAGARYMDGFKMSVPDADGSPMTTRPEYLQFYVGVTHRFAWPKGQ